MKAIKEIIEDYIHFSLDFCSKCINKYDEFYPFAFYLKKKKAMVIEPLDKTYLIDSTSQIKQFKHLGNELLKNEKSKSYCIGYDVRLKLENKHYPALALFIKINNDLEFPNGRIFYYPYSKTDEFNYVFDLAFSVEAIV